ncbi:hypothetical protein C3F09_07365 [candidate division GN15 bacterium]|uniref:histidine kinase n=1 Tax=candidate division GN15 bacterium TaxID=2072418 RepID=A0A855X122_9BACT|nr:MAG: hypothetical protein C3F09_07365 [candidate division GN15 bacterium]
MIKRTQTKLLILAGTIAVTVAIHYGYVLPYLFGHSTWVHAVHSRFCYIPIAIAAAWFGLRGGLISASAISLLVLPFVLIPNAVVPSEHFSSMSSELVEIFFYFGFGVLIGALVDRESRIRQRHESAQLQLERAKHLAVVGQMAAGVAHEIKNPLASIKGAVEIVGGESTPEADRREFRTIISKEIKRIDGTVKEFLEYARPRPTELKPLDLTALIESALRQIGAQPDHQAIHFETELEPEVQILGDSDKLHQVILNLVLNAVQASPRESVISISLRRVPGEGVRLTIKDQGKGIRPEDLPRIFEPFYTTKHRGTGLGLTIVKGIIEDHKGLIEVSSSETGGATFTVTFPPVGGVIH